MPINNIIAQGVRPLGADVPQVMGMIQDRRMQQSRNALLERDMEMREANANALAEDRAQQEQRKKAEASLAQAAWVAEKKPPKRVVEQQVEGVRDGYERLNGPGSWDLATDEQIWKSAEGSVMKLASSLGIMPPQPEQASPSDFMQKYQEARAQGFEGTPLDFQKQWTSASQGPQQPDKITSVVPVIGADGKVRYTTPAGALGKERPPVGGAVGKKTEGQMSSANYADRMDAAETLIGDYAPSFKDYVAGRRVMIGGAVTASAANSVLSDDAQSYYQAANDWVRAKLRKESGAAIGKDEMDQEIKTYFPTPGDSPDVVKQKKAARQQAVAGMRTMAGGSTAPEMFEAGKEYEDAEGNRAVYLGNGAWEPR